MRFVLQAVAFPARGDQATASYGPLWDSGHPCPQSGQQNVRSAADTHVRSSGSGSCDFHLVMGRAPIEFAAPGLRAANRVSEDLGSRGPRSVCSFPRGARCPPAKFWRHHRACPGRGLSTPESHFEAARQRSCRQKHSIARTGRGSWRDAVFAAAVVSQSVVCSVASAGSTVQPSSVGEDPFLVVICHPSLFQDHRPARFGPTTRPVQPRVRRLAAARGLRRPSV